MLFRSHRAEHDPASRQTVFYTPDTLTVYQGRPVTGRLSCAPNARNPRDLDIIVTYQLNEESEVEVHYKMCVCLSDLPRSHHHVCGTNADRLSGLNLLHCPGLDLACIIDDDYSADAALTPSGIRRLYLRDAAMAWCQTCTSCRLSLYRFVGDRMRRIELVNVRKALLQYLAIARIWLKWVRVRVVRRVT